MRANYVRVLVGIAAVAVAVVLLVVLKDGGDTGNGGGPTTTARTGSSPHAPAIPTIVIKDGEPVGGVAELSFVAGERIRFRVRSNVSDEIHVHGYDLAKDVEADGSVSFDFEATIEGVFEVELENRGEEIAELRVGP